MSIHLLSVGNNYPDTMSELRGCINDAKDTAAAFKPWCASHKVLREPGRQQLLSEGRKLLDRLERGDLGIMSVSGHGTRERIDGQWHEAIVCGDFELIYDSEFDAMLSKRAAGSYLAVFADTCHSGGLPRAIKQPRTIPVSRCRRHVPKGQRMRALKNVIYFSGSQDDEYAYDGEFSGRPNGAMTYYLLKAFRERQENTTFGQLFRKLAGKRPKGYLPNDEYDQTPTVTASAANLRRTLRSFAA